MLSNPFGKPSNKVKQVLKLGDQLALVLRENVEVINFEDEDVTYVTESGYLIEGKISFEPLGLEGITVISGDSFTNQKVFDSLVEKQVKSVLGSLLLDHRKDANKNLDKILTLWESRSKYKRVVQRLQEKQEHYNFYTHLISSQEFDSVKEFETNLISYLKENKDEFLKVKEVFNALKLSNLVAESFNLPYTSLEDLHEADFFIKEQSFDSVYELICQQELIKKDLLENKQHFDSFWITSDNVSKLVNLLPDYDEDQLLETISVLIEEAPYFAIATKKQLSTLIENALAFRDIDTVTQKAIRDLVATIYEVKKPVKAAVLKSLNKEYGINVQNLKITPSFSELAKTQKVIFETLSRLCPRRSNMKSSLKDFANLLGKHAGVDVIDINEWLNYVFQEAGFVDELNETSLMNYMNFEKVANDLSQIGSVLKMLQAGIAGQMGGGDPGMGGNPMGQPSMGQPQMQQPQMGGSGMPSKPGMGAPGAGLGGEEMPEDGQYEPDGMSEFEDEEGGEGEITPEEAAMGAQEDMADDLSDESQEDPVEPVSQDELLGYMDELEELMASIRGELGVDDFSGEEEFGDEEGFEDEDDEGGEVNLDTGDGDDDVHVDLNSHDNPDEEESGGSDGEDMDDDGDMDEPKPKKKPKPSFK